MYAVAGRGPLTFTGPAFVRYHGVCDEENETLVEACLPFWADAAQPNELPERMSVADWISAHGFAFAGPVRLVYRRWTGTPDDPGNRFEIAWPIGEPAPGTP
ncbi:hypothetical protein [Streptomyces sp. NRRL S-244]|uniref:hypothetical protein n=1 Tax=Streptomyces sp. NRRL S-244 TaxID=1463897 RepID=UPI000AA376F8|nr:hypothetical protein [Streptomyces sp. NRRL S-244]